VNWFVRQGHTVYLLADVPAQRPWPEVKLVDLSKRFYAPVLRFPIWTIWIRKFLHQWQPDILHAHRVNSAGWLAAASGFHPLVVTPWGSDVFIQPQQSNLARFLARYTLKHADMVTVNSYAMHDQVIKLNAHASAIKPIQFGVELDAFHPKNTSTRENSALRQCLGLPEEGHLVLSLRAIRPIYNIDVVLESVTQVLKDFPDTTFVFLDYNSNLEYKSWLDGLVKNLGLETHIRWLPPTNDRIVLAELYRLSDVVVSVPSSDATPVSVLEAMACGRPVICSDLASVRELITHGKNGWLVPARESKMLAEAISHLLSQPEMAAGLGLEAHQVVVEKYNYEVEMKHLEALYRGLIGGSNNPI
jgi:glycosyltransferase involved in cell wall biosynthesis